MNFSQRTLYMLCFISLITTNLAALCHKFPSRVNPEVLCNGFANLLRLDSEPDQNINKLSFSKNNITAISSSSFKGVFDSLTEIYFDNNVIENISANAFKNLQNLQVLDLSNNKLKVLDPETFSSNKKLTTIDLAGNKIKILDVNLINKLDKLEKLILSNNPLDVCNHETAKTLRYLELKKIETLFLPTCDNSSVYEEIDTTRDTKTVIIDVGKVPDAENNDTVEKFLPLMLILSAMVVLAFALGYVIANSCLKLSDRNTPGGRSRTESGKYLVSEHNRRLSTVSGEDENGYLIATNPQNIPHYLEVIDDAGQAPLISLHSEVDLRNPKTESVVIIPVPQILTPTVNHQESIYVPNHVYEEIGESFYRTNIRQHQVQPYACVKSVPGK